METCFDPPPADETQAVEPCSFCPQGQSTGQEPSLEASGLYSPSSQGQKTLNNYNLKTGHFYFGENRTFLFWLDINGCIPLKAVEKRPNL